MSNVKTEMLIFVGKQVTFCHNCNLWEMLRLNLTSNLMSGCDLHFVIAKNITHLWKFELLLKAWFICRNICGFPYFCDGLDESMDVDQQRLNPPRVLQPRQHRTCRHDGHEHCSVLPPAAKRLHSQERVHH